MPRWADCVYNEFSTTMHRRIIATITAFCMLTALYASASAQTVQYRFFPETGHNVKGEFLAYYNANPNALILFGYPITEEFKSKDGAFVQYFQRARFELDSAQPEGRRVTLSALGRLTFSTKGEVAAGNMLSCRAYPQTGFSICLDFLEFFDKYGGVEQFGYPISGFEYHEEKLVQYFEKARLEWNPWKPAGQRVTVSDLGKFYFSRLGEDLALLSPVRPLDNSQSAILQISARAFVRKAVALASDSQSIYIIVRGQNMQPVPNADCVATINWPDGSQTAYRVTTNSGGVGIIPFDFSNQPHGNLITTGIVCAYNALRSDTSTSFRIWY